MDGSGGGGHFRRFRRRRGVRPLFHGSHGHDDHNHGPSQDGLINLNIGNDKSGASGDPGRLATAGAGAAVVAAGETSSSSHGGHSHGGGMGHSHAHFHIDVASLKTRPTLIRCPMPLRGLD